jgi:diacylglycerol kinase family enzyme
VTGYLIVNPRAGEGRSLERVLDEAERRGVRVQVLGEGEDAAALARAAEAGVLGMAGGDGSLAPVAQVAVERDLPFVCVPLGTRNHFARDLGLDRDDPIAALRAFEGVERRVDIGKAGDRMFLNNVSLGLYGRLVHRREVRRKRDEALVGARALWLVLRERHPVSVRLDGEPVSARLVLVASNHYDLSLFNIGERQSLDDGLLHVYTCHGWLPHSWEERTGTEFELEASAALAGALDGEPVTLEPPIRFEIAPRALRALVPKP